ncbi:unnamed protein product [Microthlaspi erraticum]|uniref:Uncharacterized protein n=1 Tax=Microthlaspi erraticum TaxID=1685480 RepID=A0A6D2JQZ7_9BRAS|nr:unnamed protein product [Microthlaspi erraticum]
MLKPNPGRSVAAWNLAGYLPNGGDGDSGLLGGGSGTVRGCASSFLRRRTVKSGISVPETDQTKKRSAEDNTQVGGSMASKRQKKDKDNCADPPREMTELFDACERRMVKSHSVVKHTILLLDRDLQAAQKSVGELSKKNEALQAENVQFKTELIGSKDTVVTLEAEKARLAAELDLETKPVVFRRVVKLKVKP